jgi:hypothetical protein
LCLFGLSLILPGLALAGPKLVIKDTRLVLGKFHEGQLAKGVFEVLNEGDADLVIKKILPG